MSTLVLRLSSDSLIQFQIEETWPDLFSDMDEDGKIARKLALYFVRRTHEKDRSRARGVSGALYLEPMASYYWQVDSVPSTVGPRRNPVRRSVLNANRVTQISAPQDGPMPLPYSQTTGIMSIRQFLESCLPPMDHYLSRFLDSGLRTEEGLFGASRWQPHLIETFLDRLPPDASGSRILLMDKMVLLNQFATYFG